MNVQNIACDPVWLDVQCVGNGGDNRDPRSWSQFMKGLLLQAKDFGLYPEAKWVGFKCSFFSALFTFLTSFFQEAFSYIYCELLAQK